MFLARETVRAMMPMPAHEHWFWKAFDCKLAAGLDAEERAEIDRVLHAAGPQGAPTKVSDIRLTFGRFYLVIRAGREKRSRERLLSERRLHPVVTWRNIPVILLFWGSLLIGAYAALALALRGLTALLS
jgi:hypothetical protein